MGVGYRDRLIKIFTFLGGIYFFLEFVLPKDIAGIEFGKYNEQITNGFIAVSAMAIGLGLINLLLIHGSRIIFRRKGWTNSLALLLGLFSMIFLTAGDWLVSEGINKRSDEIRLLASFSRQIVSDYKNNTPKVKDIYARTDLLLEEVSAKLRYVYNEAQSVHFQGRDSQEEQTFLSLRTDLINAISEAAKIETQLKESVKGKTLENELSLFEDFSIALGEVATRLGALLNKLSERKPIKIGYKILFDGLYVALGSAMFSLLGFYIVSAAYRAFRIRNLEAALMMAAAVLVMLGQIPFYAVISEQMPLIRGWLLAVPNSGAFKAIQFGAAVAGLIMAIRVWLSIESKSFVSTGEQDGKG